ncbi:hypothetical protein QBC46DRAFT_431432 [Diplogelasinospora grovesii]|uniref:FAS1 domain-containing protein n=1 Tax=Diplogelasinospora grovesii TaxID=303347 RepID=A0AAN6RXS1_9PEZI|nr:hypothetical protein QBC46DRAFT_431432 [Diplogelasinospora grovesii]
MRQPHSAFPVVASLAAFMLVLLALLAGSSPGFLEDYNIVTFNTSELGKNLTLFPTSAGSGLPTTTTGGKCTGIFCSAATAAAGSVESHIASALDNVTDGIADFYSLHVLDICKGGFTPNLNSDL